MVFYNKEYKDVSMAMEKSDGMAVLAFFFNVSNKYSHVDFISFTAKNWLFSMKKHQWIWTKSNYFIQTMIYFIYPRFFDGRNMIERNWKLISSLLWAIERIYVENRWISCKYHFTNDIVQCVANDIQQFLLLFLKLLFPFFIE